MASPFFSLLSNRALRLLIATTLFALSCSLEPVEVVEEAASGRGGRVDVVPVKVVEEEEASGRVGGWGEVEEEVNGGGWEMENLEAFPHPDEEEVNLCKLTIIVDTLNPALSSERFLGSKCISTPLKCVP